MAAQKKSAPKKPAKGQGAPGANGTPGGTSVGAVRARNALAELTPAFVDWFAASGGTAAVAVEVFSEIEAVVGAHFQAAAEAQETAFGPEFTQAVEALIEAEPDDELAADILDAARFYVQFLEESGRWTGTGGQLAEVREGLYMAADAPLGGLDFFVPELSIEEELAGWAATPLIRSATSILTWLGEGQPVEAGEAPLPRELDGFLAAAANPHAQAIWLALMDMELVLVNDGVATPSEEVPAFLSGAPEDQVVEHRGVGSMVMAELVEESASEVGDREMAQTIAVGVLSLATGIQPLTVEQVYAQQEAGDDVDEEVGRFVTERLDALAELGLVTLDGHVVVEPFARHALSEAFGGGLY
ncbi:hypothetical protein [Arthrobacter sp. 35W]|uniref:hypothetical protein n=1 Tax=Arthrobacter sp. 35W TaxID=1132441 RepID=UPI000423A968|nr:hypothetical protein [Arthrobacter sp. 35W]